MPWLNVVLLFYAVLSLVMGILGYVAPASGKHSLISLIAGTTCAIVVALSVALVKRYPRQSRIAALVVTILMMGQFGPKAFEGSVYPGMIMFVPSIVVAICLGLGHMMGMRAKKVREAPGSRS